MIKKSDILKFIKHVHRKSSGLPDRRLMHPRREWLIGLGIFFIVVVIGAVISIGSFETYKNIDQRDYKVDVTVPTYNQKLANTVLTDYAERQFEYDAKRGVSPNRPAVVEPEIETDEDLNDSATSTLADDVWYWSNSTLAGIGTTTPENPSVFAVTFETDGTFSATTDCNSLSGSFVLDEEIITIGPIAATKKFCGEETLEASFSGQLSQATSFEITEDNLIINLSEGSGTMYFTSVVGEVVEENES